ncbi:cupin domain-containing protein [Photobacterium makurazakiensis]|uniref:cupin domain-containing protein n=1 Tax=Photobacterium makurazakiensis TaxID=2910234 RepID=UPI003D109393
MLNMDFSQRIVIDTAAMDWVASPAAGVWRKPLEREAKESGHTSSIVKYEAGSAFNTHPHPMGEEILVLDGTFSDETGDFGPGTYIRNPPDSKHAPFSQEGCTIFVKLNQFEPQDLTQVRIDTQQAQWLQGIGGLQVMPLHEFGHQHTALVKWPAGERFQPHQHFGGEEILVLSGVFRDEFGCYPAHSWLRSPHMSEHFPFVEQETVILVKTGHLPIV